MSPKRNSTTPHEHAVNAIDDVIEELSIAWTAAELAGAAEQLAADDPDQQLAISMMRLAAEGSDQ